MVRFPLLLHHQRDTTVVELIAAENTGSPLSRSKAKLPIYKSSRLLPLRSFLDESQSILRVGGRLNHSKLCYSKMHPIILHGVHPVTKLIVETEHLRLMHAAGPTLLSTISHHWSS